MARATYGLIISDMHGSIKGTTFQQNNAGAIVRTRPVYRSKRIFSLSSQQAQFKLRTTSWHDLSAADQLSWYTFANTHTKFNNYNEEKNLTGFDWFVAINCNLENIGQPPISTAPAYSTPNDVPPWSFFIDGNGLHLTPNPAYGEPDSFVQLYTTPKLRPGFLKQRTKFILTDYSSNTVSEWNNLTTKWETAHNTTFSIPPLGEHFFIVIMLRHCHHESGLCSPGLRYAADVNTTPSAGIGDMIINSNFIVS